MKLDLKFWIKFSFINLTIVAFLGTLMRYKIGFEFPYFNQKNILHSHSNFAFSGWVSHTIIVMMIYYIQTKNKDFKSTSYNKLIIANLIGAYGMLISFFIQGYGLFSIFFSVFSIVVFIFLGFRFFKDFKQIDSDNLALNWFKAAIIFNILSSLGTFFFAYMMISRNIVQNFYLASVYYYLHFQYNGWFFFACMGLLFGYFNLKKSAYPQLKSIYLLFVCSCIPAYFLSTLWLDLPMWLYLLTLLAAILQVYAWFKFVFFVKKHKYDSIKKNSLLFKNIILFVALATSLKFLLQLGSTIPALSQLAFGFRPIVIAYLHLILLAIISLYLLYHIMVNHLVASTKKIQLGLTLFMIGVIANEVILAIQGVAAFSYTLIPKVNELLLLAALLLFTGMTYTTLQILKKEKNSST